jgi:hypothetical protein
MQQRHILKPAYSLLVPFLRKSMLFGTYDIMPFFGEGPRYGRTAALRLIVQSCDEDDCFFFCFSE